MSFRLYASRAGEYLLVPECMQASRAATEQFGPLTFPGCADPSALDQPDLGNIWSQLDAASFAIIDEKLAQALWKAARK